jgi:hypothetical protein
MKKVPEPATPGRELILVDGTGAALFLQETLILCGLPQRSLAITKPASKRAGMTGT